MGQREGRSRSRGLRGARLRGNSTPPNATSTPHLHGRPRLRPAAPFLKEPLQVHDSDVLIPDRPGTGIEWDEAAVARYEA